MFVKRKEQVILPRKIRQDNKSSQSYSYNQHIFYLSFCDAILHNVQKLIFNFEHLCVYGSVSRTEFCKSHFVSFRSLVILMLLISSSHYAPATSVSLATALGPLLLLYVSYLFLF
jgi:hypothetical protein